MTLRLRLLCSHSVRLERLTFCLMLIGVLCGCDSSPATVASGDAAESPPPTPTAPAIPSEDKGQGIAIAELREQLGIGQAGEIRKVGGEIVAMDLRGTAVVDLSPLAGLPLRQLFLEETGVTDLSPLAGMPFEQLYLSNTPVTDLAPLSGMTIKELNLVGTPLENLEGLKDIDVETLWIPQTKVTDLSPLAGRPLVSLDIQDTPVSNLTPLAGNSSLRRLHIGGTAVSDLTPLTGLHLERLVFSPENITSGLEAIRNMSSLRGLDVEFDGTTVMPPDQFWPRYDAGEWPAADVKPSQQKADE